MNDRDQFKQKSNENWKAAEVLRKDFKNAAVNRYYYSLYQAIRYWADAKNVFHCSDFVGDVHATVANIVGNNCGKNAREMRGIVNDMREQRVIADYSLDDVVEEEVQPIIQMASAARAEFLSLRA